MSSELVLRVADAIALLDQAEAGKAVPLAKVALNELADVLAEVSRIGHMPSAQISEEQADLVRPFVLAAESHAPRELWGSLATAFEAWLRGQA